MKRLNPITNLPFRHGDIREDNYVFFKYTKKLKKDGYFAEHWYSPIAWENYKLKLKNESSLKNDKQKQERKTITGRAKILLATSKYRAKEKNYKFDLDLNWFEEKLKTNKCELTFLEFNYDSNNGKYNPYSPSIDRIDSSKGYTKDNCRVVLTAVNLALNVFGLNEVLPIFEALVQNQRESS